MDILQKYNQENPELSSQRSQWEGSEEYGMITHFIIRLSGGRIQDARQANKALVILLGIILLLSFIIINQGGSQLFSDHVKRLPDDPLRIGPTTTP